MITATRRRLMMISCCDNLSPPSTGDAITRLASSDGDEDILISNLGLSDFRRCSGLFLVAYYILLVMVCIPVCYVQIKLGSYFRTGIVGVCNYVMPILKGAGVALLLITYLKCLLHGVDMAYAFYYMIASVKLPFPWNDGTQNKTIQISNNQVFNTPSEKYFYEEFLQRSQHIGSCGSLLWYLALIFLTIWLCIYLCIFKGSRALGKISYVIAPVSIVLLMVILIYGHVTLPKARDSLKYVFSDYVHLIQANTQVKSGQTSGTLNSILQSRLGSPEIWIDALYLHTQSLGLWSGVLPTLGSHLYHKKAVINISWLSLILMHSILPHVIIVSMAPYVYYDLDNLIFYSAKGMRPGTPLLFVTLPNVFSQVNGSPAIIICFYLSYILLGMLHQSVYLLAIVENMLRGCPDSLKRVFRRDEWIIALLCFASCLLSFGYASQCGFHLYRLVQDYADRLIFVPLILCLIPLVRGYVRQNTMHLPIERVCMSVWFGLISLVSAGLLMYYFITSVYPHPVVGYDNRWAEFMGWGVATVPISLGLALGGLHSIWKEKGNLKKKLSRSMKCGMELSDLHETEIHPVTYMDVGKEGLNVHDTRAIPDIITDVEVTLPSMISENSAYV